jgi:hypothetical protein
MKIAIANIDCMKNLSLGRITTIISAFIPLFRDICKKTKKAYISNSFSRVDV